MILKVTVFGLILLLIAIIAVSYYMNEEGFANITLTASESLVNSTSLAAACKSTAAFVAKVDAELAAAKAKADAATKAVTLATDKTKVAAVAAQTAANTAVIAATKASTDAHTVATKAAVDLQAASKAHTANTLKEKANEVAAKAYNTHMDADDTHRITNPVSHPMGQPTVTLSDTGYAATELHQKTGLLQDIQKIVHNELLASRSTEPVHGGKVSHSSSASISQGNEYNKASMKKSDSSCEEDELEQSYNNSCPDMSQYIKKDSIPCAGCNLDY